MSHHLDSPQGARFSLPIVQAGPTKSFAGQNIVHPRIPSQSDRLPSRMSSYWYVISSAYPIGINADCICCRSQVNFATHCNISLLASSGQHGFSTTLSEVQNGLEIDMSLLRSVSVDADQNTLTVGGGVRFLDVIDPVFEAGKEISEYILIDMVARTV